MNFLNYTTLFHLCQFLLGQAWAAVTTEGLLIYSLDPGYVFDPFHLDTSITPDSVRATLKEKDYATGVWLFFPFYVFKIICTDFKKTYSVNLALFFYQQIYIKSTLCVNLGFIKVVQKYLH